MIIATIQLISYMPIMEHTIYYSHHVGRKHAQQLNHKIISLKKINLSIVPKTCT